MRTIEKWKTRHLAKELEQFTPRTKQLLQEIYPQDNLPDEIDNSCFIHGETGYGKTIYAASLLLQEKRNLYLQGEVKDCYFVNIADLFDEIKESYDKSSFNKESEILGKYSFCHLLVLDDFGTVKPSEWLLQNLYLIINRRYEYLKKTIITSNYNLDGIAEMFGDIRITSRIERMCEIINKKHWKK